MPSKAKIFAIVSVLACQMQLAHSETSTATINVSLTVTSVCSVDASNMDFPHMQTGKSDVSDTTSIFTVNCSKGADYAIELDEGKAVPTGRQRMRRGSPSDYVNYNLYMDSGHKIPWTTNAGLSGTGAIQTIMTYGAIPSAQEVRYASNHTNQIFATIIY